MPDMKDPLLKRIRKAAQVSAPELNPSVLITRKSQKANSGLKFSLAFLAIAAFIITASLPQHRGLESYAGTAYYGEHDSYPFEDYAPAWNLGWFGGKATAYELKVRPDIVTREALLESELSDIDKTKLGGLSLEGYGGQWIFTCSELFEPSKALGELPNQTFVRDAANKIFIASGFEGDLNTTKFESDSQTITASVDQKVGGKSVGMVYSVTFMRGGILMRATGWLVSVVEHRDLPTISVRDVVCTIKWRTVNHDFPFKSRRWEGDSNPQDTLVGWDEDLPPITGMPPITNLKQHHLTITASSRAMTMTQTALGSAWVVPSYYLASGKTVIGNYPAMSEDTLREAQR